MHTTNSPAPCSAPNRSTTTTTTSRPVQEPKRVRPPVKNQTKIKTQKANTKDDRQSQSKKLF
jgi:hypothetical protein